MEQVAELAVAKERITPHRPELPGAVRLGPAAPGGKVNKDTEPKKTAKAVSPKKPPEKPSTIEADMEDAAAAAAAEPMGSIAAAVPGSNHAAEDPMRTGKQPGTEAQEIRNQPDTTAGTEAKREGEEPGSR